MAARLRIELSGPLFTKNHVTTVRGAQRKIVQRVTAAGRKNVKDSLTRGRGRDSGAFKRSIKGKSRRSVGRVYSTNSMLSGWLEDGGTRFRWSQRRRGRFQGYGIWRNGYEKTDREAGAEARRLLHDLRRELGG